MVFVLCLSYYFVYLGWVDRNNFLLVLAYVFFPDFFFFCQHLQNSFHTIMLSQTLFNELNLYLKLKD